MKKVVSSLAVLALFASLAHAQAKIKAVVGEDSLFTIVANEDVKLTGLDFQSPAGKLIPAASAAPFTFNLQNEPKAVVYATIPGSVSFAAGSETKLSAGYSGDLSSGDLGSEYGEEGVITPVAFPVEGVQAPDVPEPATGILAAFGLMALLGLRRRR